jgi:hypothetical protein
MPGRVLGWSTTKAAYIGAMVGKFECEDVPELLDTFFLGLRASRDPACHEVNNPFK